MTAYWPIASFFFVCLQTETETMSMNLKKKQGYMQYPAILPEQAWPMKDLLYGFWGNFSSGTQPVVPSGSQSQHRSQFILPTHRASHKIK